jgi:hypothetical protein
MGIELLFPAAVLKNQPENGDSQKNGGRKMKVARFAQKKGGQSSPHEMTSGYLTGRLIFLPRIFLTSSSQMKWPCQPL